MQPQCPDMDADQAWPSGRTNYQHKSQKRSLTLTDALKR
jgi:hypothetical protein